MKSPRSHSNNQANEFRPNSWLRWLFAVSALVLLPMSVGSSRAGETKGLDVRGPVVREPVAPKVLDMDLQELLRARTVQPWKPGDPIRVIDDLKETNEPSPDEGELGPDEGGERL